MTEHTKSTEEVRTALQLLGVKGRFSVHSVASFDMERLIVSVNGIYFGIYDTVRNTFVD